eukprot:XP_001699386.1 predicted protein [Chlamydomonas reinhardtii]
MAAYAPELPGVGGAQPQTSVSLAAAAAGGVPAAAAGGDEYLATQILDPWLLGATQKPGLHLAPPGKAQLGVLPAVSMAPAATGTVPGEARHPLEQGPPPDAGAGDGAGADVDVDVVEDPTPPHLSLHLGLEAPAPGAAQQQQEGEKEEEATADAGAGVTGVADGTLSAGAAAGAAADVSGEMAGVAEGPVPQDVTGDVRRAGVAMDTDEPQPQPAAQQAVELVGGAGAGGGAHVRVEEAAAGAADVGGAGTSTPMEVDAGQGAEPQAAAAVASGSRGPEDQLGSPVGGAAAAAAAAAAVLTSQSQQPSLHIPLLLLPELTPQTSPPQPQPLHGQAKRLNRWEVLLMRARQQQGMWDELTTAGIAPTHTAEDRAAEQAPQRLQQSPQGPAGQPLPQASAAGAAAADDEEQEAAPAAQRTPPPAPRASPKAAATPAGKGGLQQHQQQQPRGAVSPADPSDPYYLPSLPSPTDGEEEAEARWARVRALGDDAEEAEATAARRQDKSSYPAHKRPRLDSPSAAAATANGNGLPDVVIADCAERRTCKLLGPLGRGVPVLSARWLRDSAAAARFLDPFAPPPPGLGGGGGGGGGAGAGQAAAVQDYVLHAPRPHLQQAGVFAGVRLYLAGDGAFRSTFGRVLSMAGALLMEHSSHKAPAARAHADTHGHKHAGDEPVASGLEAGQEEQEAEAADAAAAGGAVRLASGRLLLRSEETPFPLAPAPLPQLFRSAFRSERLPLAALSTRLTFFEEQRKLRQATLQTAAGERVPDAAGTEHIAEAGVNGYAKYWWEPAIGVMPDGNPCHAHPERAYYDLTDAEGFFLESPHGIPYHEDGITFEFREQTGGDLTTRVCPGANYTGKLSLPVLGLALLSMSEGRFLSPGPTPGCSPRAQTSFAFAFAVPCNLTGGSAGDLEFRVTAAQRGYPSTWMQAAATLAAAGPGECPQQQRVLACGADASGGGTLDPADPKLQPDPASGPWERCDAMRAALMAGDIDKGLEIMRAICPAALEDVRLVFRAKKQKFVELLRAGGDAEAALDLRARNRLHSHVHVRCLARHSV